MKKAILIALFFVLISHKSVFAVSSYVLPYPGIMPGSKLYVISDFLDHAKSFYIFGDLARFKYNLSQSDKYLVEAKTLFEYGQYPLAVKSLAKSDVYFKNTVESLRNARESGKNISRIQEILGNASAKHAEVILDLKNNHPEVFLWEYEKKPSEEVFIKESLNKSQSIRLSYYD